MEGIYPVIIDGEPVGKLTVEQQGQRTVFTAETRQLQGIVRISVYGEGKEGYLGVLAPAGSGLSLHKTFSRSELRKFPGTIESAERAGLSAERSRAAAQSDGEPAEPADNDAAPGKPPEDDAAPAEPPQVLTGRQTGEAAAPEPPEELPAGEKEDDLYWYSSPDGALVRFDGETNLIALPLDDPRVRELGGGSPRTVDGRQYVVFRTRNGKLIR